MKTIMLSIAFLSATIPSVAIARDAASAPASVKRFMSASEAQRAEKVIRLNEWIKKKREALKVAKTREARERLKEEIRTYEQMVKQAKDHWEPAMLTKNMAVGDVGIVDGLEIIHIIDDKSMIIRPTLSNLGGIGPQMYLSGVSTAGHVDGKYLATEFVLEIVGTRKSGGTIYAVQLVPFEEWREAVLPGTKKP